MIALECLVVRFALEVERSCSKKTKGAFDHYPSPISGGVNCILFAKIKFLKYSFIGHINGFLLIKG